MRIAIITLPLHGNYGGILQNYALQTVLKRMGHTVETVAFPRELKQPLWRKPLAYGNKSYQLVRHYAEDLGYEYLSADIKEEYLQNLERFLTPEITDRPMLFEVFTNNEDESEAIRMMNTLNVSASGMAKELTKAVLGEKGKNMVKKMLGK